MTISFTNSVGYTHSFSTNELTIIIKNLTDTNSYYTNGLNDLLYVRINKGIYYYLIYHIILLEIYLNHFQLDMMPVTLSV